MPRIYDNIVHKTAEGLKENIEGACSTDFCVGYFNLRGWRELVDHIEVLPGRAYPVDEDNPDQTELINCRLLVGMQRMPEDYLRDYYNRRAIWQIDQESLGKLRRKMAQQFREQLMIGYQTDEDETNLRKLLAQLKTRKVVVKLYLEKLLHAKLYIAHHENNRLPRVAMLGSSNLTMSGMDRQCELNVDFKDEDDTAKVAAWFEERWTNRWTLDITQDLVEVLEESWVSPHTPFEIYLKILYHLSSEARTGIAEFKLPAKLKAVLLNFQQEAVLRAAKMVVLRGGVMLGDVVGLGKTIMAVALAKLFEDDHRVLIICPPKLKSMWEDYLDLYRLDAKVVSLGRVNTLRALRQSCNFIIIDESHNLRNHNTKRYKYIKHYIDDLKEGRKIVLLSATPYNKQMLDLSAQLRLFLTADEDLGIAPERAIHEAGGRPKFLSKGDFAINSIAAFERSNHMDDWRELMRLFLVRRTRSFIKLYYATKDDSNNRYYLTFADGTRSYFPDRLPKLLDYTLPDDNQYAKLYSAEVVSIISELNLPRYGLGLEDYHDKKQIALAHSTEIEVMSNLARAGRRLKGFAKTNLFKRLESSGFSFLISVSRHVMRNCLFIYAIEQGLDLPIGQQEADLLDENLSDLDPDGTEKWHFGTLDEYSKRAAKYYQDLKRDHENYDWINSKMFNAKVRKELLEDAINLIKVLALVPNWIPNQDTQLAALLDLVNVKHSQDKILIFTQFSDTAEYLHEQIKANTKRSIGLATGNTDDPTEMAKRFSPSTNNYNGLDPIDILVATDVLSEGQNLQDSHIIVNYDLPWAIIRLIQRAGRVDRLGQKSDKILCYSVLPTAGIEKIITLRKRLTDRLEQADQVIGSPDEIFFEGQKVAEVLHALYTEKDGTLNDREEDIDLASEAYMKWQKMQELYPQLCAKVVKMPDVVYTAKKAPTITLPSLGQTQTNKGVIVYTHAGRDNEILTWLDDKGQIVTSSQSDILNAAKCELDEPIAQKLDHHHELVGDALQTAAQALQTEGGHLGRKTSVRYKLYHMLDDQGKQGQQELFDQDLDLVQDQVYQYPLTEYAFTAIRQRIRSGAKPKEVVLLAKSLYDQGYLCVVSDQDTAQAEAKIICSMGLV